MRLSNFFVYFLTFFFSSRRRHTRSLCDWSSDVCSSDLSPAATISSRPRSPPTSRSFARIAATGWGKIGRASCRERVYIGVSGVEWKEYKIKWLNDLQGYVNDIKNSFTSIMIFGDFIIYQ